MIKTVLTASAFALAAVSASADGYTAAPEPIVIEPVMAEKGSLAGAWIPLAIGAALIALAVSQKD